MPYDCGDPACVIRSDAGKDFERVIAYATTTLQHVFDLVGAMPQVRVAAASSISDPVSGARVHGLLGFTSGREKLQSRPFDQSLQEECWTSLESVLGCFTEKELLLFQMWVRPAEPTLAEMAFCRVVDGWKFYMEELSGKRYGSHKDLLVGEEVMLDQVLNETRNLFVHCGGIMGLNKMKEKTHLAIFQEYFDALKTSKSRIVDLCRHALGLPEGHLFQLGMKETLNYLGEVGTLLQTIELRRTAAGAK